MITEKLQNAINEQITAEMWSSNLYLAMSFYMDKEGYCGMASWLKKQAHEEHEHACELASYIIKRGGKAKLDKIDVVPNDFGTPLEVFEQVYEHECRVSKMKKIKLLKTSCGDSFANRWKKKLLPQVS